MIFSRYFNSFSSKLNNVGGFQNIPTRKNFNSNTIMVVVEFLAALCAVALCGPCLLACARRLIAGDEILQSGGGHRVHEADVLGCDEPNCPYYKKNIRYLMIRSPKRFSSPSRHT